MLIAFAIFNFATALIPGNPFAPLNWAVGGFCLGLRVAQAVNRLTADGE